jgi:hypothetical protein
MNKLKTFFVVSEYWNNISWIYDYTDNYIIYDKSNSIQNDDKVIKLEDVGYNIYDYCHFIVNNYDSLPDLTAFLEGNPFDHCKKEEFDKLIRSNSFAPIEYYGKYPANVFEQRDENGGFMEINNSWYIQAHIKSFGSRVNRFFSDYNDFLDEMFDNPEHPRWIRFAPGGQYVVPKNNILYYSKDFYSKIMKFVDYCDLPSEAHIIERALYYIFTNKWRERK